MTSFRLRMLLAVSVILTVGFQVFSQTTTVPARTTSRAIRVIVAEGVIGPTIADYIVQGIEVANLNQDECIIIELDTPGGLVESTRQIVQAILISDVPVVTFVWPEGAQAASAGTFIVLASHVAAMGDQTVIGAAHPVGMQGEAVDEKIVNNMVSYIRMLAERRGRNVDWAESAVRESASITATEALELNVIDLIATSTTDLLLQLDDRTVTVAGEARTLRTRDSEIVYQRMNWVQNFFQVIGHPNIAYILLVLGIWGLYFELANPGMIFPGTVGGVSLILALLSLSVLPVNLAGLLLILLAIVLFTMDLFTPTDGLLTAGGIVAFVLGSFLLFPAAPYGRVPWALIIPATGTTALFFGIVLWLVIKAQRSAVIVGVERLIGAVGYAQTELNPLGVVQVAGEQWSAESAEGTISKGEKVVVGSVSGLTVKVYKLKEAPTSRSE